MPTSEIPSSHVSIEIGELASNAASNSNVASPLRTAETFDTYCSQVQSKLAENAAHRKEFLQSAHERLTRLLQTARDIGDTNLYNEIGMHRIAARELLEALAKNAAEGHRGTESAPALLPHANNNISNAQSRMLRNGPSNLGGLSENNRPAPAERPIANGNTLHGPRTAPQEDANATSRFPRRAVRPILEIETDAHDLREELRDWNTRYPLMKPEGGLHGPNCLRLRAIACRQRKLEEEAGDAEITEVNELYDDILDLLEAANDQEYSVALDDDVEPKPTAWQWGEMAERYEEMSRAQEAFDWWQKHRAHLTVADVQPLAEAVAAVQQRFNRLLFRVGARDPFQQQLFDDLRTWAREDQCYLYSLRPKVPMQELVERAGTLEEAWEHARQPIFEDERRQQVLANVIRLVNEPEFGATPERDERRLRDMLAECKVLRIGVNDRKLRDALLPWAIFLEGDERFKDFHREVNLEWERRLDSAKSEEAPMEPEGAIEALRSELADALDGMLEKTRGKRCLILGGEPHEDSHRRIEGILELQELIWPEARPSDPLAKFDSDIRHADIVALVSRFSRKEWTAVADICDRERKGFVHVMTGSGVNHVIRQIAEQLGTDQDLSAEPVAAEVV